MQEPGKGYSIIARMAAIFSSWKSALARSSRSALGRLAAVLGTSEINAGLYAELEELFILADMGVDSAQAILEQVRDAVRERGLVRAEQLMPLVEELLLARLGPPAGVEFPASPSVILVVGVNGSGKTTTVAKLGARFRDMGKRVLLIGADTYRAAAAQQLQIWADRLGLDLVRGEPGSDPGSVVYDGIQSAVAQRADLALVDTAGRLHTKQNLMDELGKLERVAGKLLTGAPQAVWLVLDATTGQNALTQARVFRDAVRVSGVVLAKLDTSARGGMAFSVQEQLGLPILFAGLGEKAEDLVPFDPGAFVQGILSR